MLKEIKTHARRNAKSRPPLPCRASTTRFARVLCPPKSKTDFGGEKAGDLGEEIRMREAASFLAATYVLYEDMEDGKV